jgi:hypothetical protein
MIRKPLDIGCRLMTDWGRSSASSVRIVDNLCDFQQNIATIELAEELDISRSNIAVAYEADRKMKTFRPGRRRAPRRHAMMFAGICNP